MSKKNMILIPVVILLVSLLFFAFSNGKNDNRDLTGPQPTARGEAMTVEAVIIVIPDPPSHVQEHPTPSILRAPEPPKNGNGEMEVIGTPPSPYGEVVPLPK